MNILFIIPLNEPYETIITANQSVERNKLNINKNIKKLYCVYPSGVLSIASYLKKNIPELNIKIIDLNVIIHELAKDEIDDFHKLTFEGFLDKSLKFLDGFKPDLIGISLLFSSVYRDLNFLSSFLKKRFNDKMLVCGGHLASTLYERIFCDKIKIDAIAYSEGEIPFLNLIGAIISNNQESYLKESENWITKEKLDKSTNFKPVASLIDNLDEIPPYDLKMLVFPDAYYDSSSFLFMPEKKEYQKEMIMFSTRGCPFNCVFCASHQVHGKKVRFFSANRIKEDILFYNKKYGIEKFTFYDDHILINKERALEILDFIYEKNFTASIINPAFFSIDEELAIAMKKAKIRSVVLSIESGNHNTFKNIIRKPGTLERANETVEHLHKVGINCATNVLIGFPGETKESIEDGLNYLLTTNFNWVFCFVVAPLPGSDLFRICEENGHFASGNDILAMDFKSCVVKTDDFSPEFIEDKAYEMNLKLNFLNNFDFRTGNYENALMLFERVIHTVMDTHAFALYFAAKCCLELGEKDKFELYKKKYEEVIKQNSFWQNLSQKYNLEDLN